MFHRMSRGLAALLCATAPDVAAQEAPPRLGRISFPTSAGPAAQQEFLAGVLWMHSFEYPRAAAAFQRAQRLEPGFALAYWGEAMSHTHAVWNEQDLAAARAVLGRLGADRAARRGMAPTDRERLYLEAVEILYGEGSKPRRDTLYAEAMERLVRAHPDDLEAKAFYSLALIGLSQGVRDTATYRRAAAWADTVFAANPDHPGAAHYLIHAWDDPVHAHLGLAAARAYSGIAPDAAHAQHMTTHIFLALGMWDEVVSQNTLAMNLTARLPGHYTLWLHYALVQQGRWKEAAEFLAELRENMVTQRAPREGILALMRAGHVLGSANWETDLATWAIDLARAPAGSRAPEVYLQGAHAYFMAGDRGGVEARARELHALAPVVARGSPLGEGDPSVGSIRVMATELDGLALILAGRREEGLAMLRRATAMEDALPLEFGPPAIVQPSHELLGVVLMETDPAGAAREFEAALRLAPGRLVSTTLLLGAALEARDTALARRARPAVERLALQADPELREFLAGLLQP